MYNTDIHAHTHTCRQTDIQPHLYADRQRRRERQRQRETERETERERSPFRSDTCVQSMVLVDY